MVSLIEYHWNGSSYELANTFTFTEGPSSIEKSAKVEWRINFVGRTEFKKWRWRYRRVEEITLEGILVSEDERFRLEALATRNSKFRLDLEGRFKSPTSEGKDFGSTYPPVEATAFYLITDFNCSQEPGKTTYKYKLKLERVG